MSRYIDLDKLTWKAVMVRDVAIPIYLKDDVDNASTEDVAPVVHAHWIKSGMLGTVFCSNCGRTAPSMDDYYGDAIWYYDTPYCPYCGAKMDEEVKE